MNTNRFEYSCKHCNYKFNINLADNFSYKNCECRFLYIKYFKEELEIKYILKYESIRNFPFANYFIVLNKSLAMITSYFIYGDDINYNIIDYNYNLSDLSLDQIQKKFNNCLLLR